MSNTLNKDGTPRKVGSGKTKGAGCYGEISWKQLKKVIAEDVKFPVSRVWLKNIGLHIEPATEVTKAQQKILTNSLLPKSSIFKRTSKKSMKAQTLVKAKLMIRPHFLPLGRSILTNFR